MSTKIHTHTNNCMADSIRIVRESGMSHLSLQVVST